MESAQVGSIKLEGGRVNYSRPLLLKNGSKVAVACGNDIRILEVANGRHVSTLNIHKFRVVGLAYHNEGKNILSVDAKGYIYSWKYSTSDVECQYISKFPIPKGCEAENIAYIGCADKSLALIIRTRLGVNCTNALLFVDDMTILNKSYAVLMENILNGHNMFAFSNERKWGAVITDNHTVPSFNIIPIKKTAERGSRHFDHMDKRKNRRYLTGERQATSIAIHPTDDIVAIGDQLGGIELIYKVFDDTNSRRRFHWHTAPVNDMVFSHSGAELYSGGNEGVIVQWFLKGGHKKDKSTLTQLGQPITHMDLSLDNSTLLATHIDNSFSSVDVLEFKLSSLILGQGVGCPKLHSGATNRPLTAYDQRTDAIVTKARPGYLHFYHARSHQQLYLVDIAKENFIGNVVVTERDVTAMSLSSDGLQMVTVDSLGDEPAKQNLKFWSFDSANQSWVLITSVLNPHFSLVKGCLMQPTNQTSLYRHRSATDEGSPQIYQCLTWATDGDIKLWSSVQMDGDMKWAILHEATFIQHKEPTCATWSDCGKVVALGYGSVISLWDAEKLTCKVVLSKQELFDAPITSLRFCPLRPHILVSCSSDGIIAWSLLTRSILYHAPLRGECLESDRQTGLMAVSTEEKQIVLFSAEVGDPLHIIDLESKAITLQFCPTKSTRFRSSCTKLLYYSQNMDLFSVPIALNGSEFEDSKDVVDSLDAPSKTLLSQMVSESKSIAPPSDDLFAFTYDDRCSLDSATLKKEILGKNIRLDEMVNFDTLFDLLDK